MSLNRETIINVIIGAGNPPSRDIAYAPQANRRNFLKWGVAGLAGALGADFVLSHSPRNAQKTEEARQYEREGQIAREDGKPLQTKYFAGELFDAATRELPFGLDELGVLVGVFAGTTFGQTLLRFKPGLFDRAVGLGSGLTARTIDEISTLVAAASFADPRVKEYGLDAYFYENSAELPADLTPKALLDKELVSDLELAGFTVAFPMVGKIYLAISPFVFKSNLDVAHAIVNSLTFGDRVKTMIEEGKSGQDVLTYLKNIGQE